MDQPYRAPHFNGRDFRTPAEIEEARLRVARGRRVFLGLALVTILLEIGVPVTGWRHPSGLRVVLSFGTLAGIWLGSRRVLIFAMLYWSFLAVATGVLSVEDQHTVAIVGLAIAALYGLMAFAALLSESLNEFVRQQRSGPDEADCVVGQSQRTIPSRPAARALPIVAAMPRAREEVSPPTADDSWPVCPECGARRTTRCPVCRTSGVEFAAGDPAFSGERRLVICPTCDEPFAPEHARQCEWCGHDFAEGFDPDPPVATYEPMDWRPIVAILVLLAIVAGMAAYLTRLF